MSDREAQVVAQVDKRLFLGGKWRDASSGAAFEVEDPSTRKVLCEVADAGKEDALEALDAAERAQPEWAKVAPRERSQILYRSFQLLMERQEELAVLMTLEMGKPLAEAKGEIAYAAEFFRWFAEEAVRIDGGFATSPDGKSRFLIMRQPVGPCMLITPWNFPMAMGTRKIGPAIASGCTMILKPAHQTPLSALALAGILNEAGLPEGVLSVLPTTDPGGVTEPLLTDGRSLVRGKVRGFAWLQHPNTAQGRRVRILSKRHFKLARRYAEQFSKPRLVAVGGLIGTGKSTVGRQLAQRLGRPFVDTDERLIARFGCPIGEVFRTRGEAVFRAAEAEEDTDMLRLARPTSLLITAALVNAVSASSVAGSGSASGRRACVPGACGVPCRRDDAQRPGRRALVRRGWLAAVDVDRCDTGVGDVGRVRRGGRGLHRAGERRVRGDQVERARRRVRERGLLRRAQRHPGDSGCGAVCVVSGWPGRR